MGSKSAPMTPGVRVFGRWKAAQGSQTSDRGLAEKGLREAGESHRAQLFLQGNGFPQPEFRALHFGPAFPATLASCLIYLTCFHW